MKHYFYIIAILTLLSACGDDTEITTVTAPDDVSDNSVSETENQATSSTLEFLVDSSGGLANIPATIPSSATALNTTIVADDFSYNPLVEQHFIVDISGYSTAPAYLSFYGDFSENEDGTFTAHYNSRIISASLENGQVTLDYVSADSQYYVLAEVWFYDSINPLQKRIPNTDSSWVW